MKVLAIHFNPAHIWSLVGIISQIMFMMRFVVQWIMSEMKGESVMPPAFWYFSILGSLGLLAYSIYRQDPIFIAGQSFGLLVYSRNLALNKK